VFPGGRALLFGVRDRAARACSTIAGSEELKSAGASPAEPVLLQVGWLGRELELVELARDVEQEVVPGSTPCGR
jgi:hypothetical protein